MAEPRFAPVSAFVGIGYAPEHVKTIEYAQAQSWARSQAKTSSGRIRCSNDRNVVTWRYSTTRAGHGLCTTCA
jgi:xylan 1,4-beta-xylosidase